MDIFKELAKPFEPNEILWRIGRCGIKEGKPWATALAYVDARAIQWRLDSLCDDWSVTYRAIQSEHRLVGWVSSITIHVGEKWISREDGSDLTDIEGFKGGISKAFVRAASAFGMGRYLYDLEEAFVETSLTRRDGWKYQPKNDKKEIPAFYWREPRLDPVPEVEPEPKPAAGVPAPAPVVQPEPAKATETPPDPLKALADALERHKWTPKQVNHYCKLQHGVASARLLNAEQLGKVYEVVYHVQPDVALKALENSEFAKATDQRLPHA